MHSLIAPLPGKVERQDMLSLTVQFPFIPGKNHIKGFNYIQPNVTRQRLLEESRSPLWLLVGTADTLGSFMTDGN